ncbi:hypothetical protein [Cedecea sp. MMO-103]|uniref:hypothetical protein n=1 Tax=Cedecea sp. MMO-103 TaxID=3081238 RepID=UPI003016E091
MLKIRYTASHFPTGIYGNKLAGTHILPTDWHEIIWAAITVGKRNATEVNKHGKYSTYEIMSRAMLIWTSLKSSNGYLEKSSVYQEMDPTEKGFVSFSLGMAISKLFISKLLNVHWLEHVANINNSIKTRAKTKSRPDLIGLNTRKEFVIVEAKGRSNGFNLDAQIKAKKQTRVISTIDSKYPVLRIASQCYFDESLEVCIEDPEDIIPDAIEVETNLNIYFEKYYGIFYNLENEELDLLKSMGIEISLSDNLSIAIRNNSFENFTVDNDSPFFDESGFKCFPDGIKIKLDSDFWAEGALELEPEKRQ